MKRRIEPEPALGRKLALHVHVGDQESVAEHLAFPLETHQIAQRAARAVGGDDVVGRDRVAPVWRLDVEPDSGIVLFDAHRPVPPAHAVPERPETSDQGLFEVVLLQVHERRPPVARLRQQVEAVREFVAEENLADAPADSARADRLPQPSRSRISSARLA